MSWCAGFQVVCYESQKLSLQLETVYNAGEKDAQVITMYTLFFLIIHRRTGIKFYCEWVLPLVKNAPKRVLEISSAISKFFIK